MGQRGRASAQTGGSTAPVALLLKLEEKKDPLGRIKGLSVPSAASFPKTLTTSYQAEQLTEKQTQGLGWGGDHSRVMKTLAQLIFILLICQPSAREAAAVFQHPGRSSAGKHAAK